MASRKGSQRKRKSEEMAQIFEVSEDDLSPEELEDAEPAAKVPKFSEASPAADNDRLNLKDADLSSKPQVESSAIMQEVMVISDDSDAEVKPSTRTDRPEVFVVVDSADDSFVEESQVNKEPLTCAIPDKSQEDSTGCDLVDNMDKEAVVVLDESSVQQDVLLLNESEILSKAALEEGEVLEEPQEAVCPPKGLQITVKFSDQSAADLYRQVFFHFLTSLPDLEVESVDDLTINVYRMVAEELLPPVTPKKKRKKRKRSEMEELFVVDTNPTVGHQRPALMQYSTKFLINDEAPEEEKAVGKPGFGTTCFNCGEAHALRMCPEPKNYRAINANRQKFLNKSKTTRYHANDSDVDKFNHLRPGQLSLEARKALRLKKNQLPSFIYKMRRIGYPPGWLEEAKVADSELEMFDIEGKHLKNANQGAAHGLDPDKVVDYPGFNIPIEKPFKDEYKYYSVAPYSDKFHKKHMIAAFQMQAATVRDDLEMQDMDIDSQDEKEATDKLLESGIDSDSNNDPSVSLVDLQMQKDSLLAEIQKAAETVPWSTNNAVADPPEQSLKKVDETASLEVEQGRPDGEESQEAATKNSVRESVFGTPILKSLCSFSRLPAADNFTKGVSPVIDFENLPNSTGKYEQMTDVLKKVRDTLKRSAT